MHDLVTSFQDGDSRTLTSKGQDEYDCKGERYRVLYYSNHSKNMGGGVIVHFNPDPMMWLPVPPGSVVEHVWKMVCK